MGIFLDEYLCRLSISSLVAPTNVFMAPMYGVTDAAFRLNVLRMGAGIAFTEMVHVEDLLKKKMHAISCARFDAEEEIKAVQLIGRDYKLFQKLMGGELLSEADLIDVNMGCAVPEIVHSGRGCALIHDLPRASRIIEACKMSGKAVSVKCRPGVLKNENNIRAFARMCEESGADMITVHGRVGEMQHEGPVSYDAIADAKACVHIPVIGNGGIFSDEDAAKMMMETGADGVMIGRCALQNPEIFRILTGI